MKLRLLCLALCLSFFPCAAFAQDDEDELPPWLGTYCDETRCLFVPNLREGPMGFYIYYRVETRDGAAIGGEIAAVEGYEGSDMNLVFSLAEDGSSVTVSLDPALPQDPNEMWTVECAGTYVRMDDDEDADADDAEDEEEKK
ncbi:hypothetical protein LJC23_00580 [Desulfovibrio sp. OttesenSCG-928-I05]|nr:hypothetical protein [Desulfovibrio sp. OttesenSCG-928-I05]